jgi:3-phytase
MDAARSIVIGTDKEHGGLGVYDLAGDEIQYLAVGDLNNVDLRDGFRLGSATVTLVTAADSATHTLAIYRVDVRTRKLVDVAAREIEVGIAAYGLCMYTSRESGKVYVFVNSEAEDGSAGGEAEQWELFANVDDRVDARRVRSFSVGSQTEGCVADDELGFLYVGEEAKGIWKYRAEPDAGTSRTLVDSTGEDGRLEADVEGLTLAYGPRQTGYLIASSQGDSSFVLYRRQGRNKFVERFAVKAGRGIDAVEETDGIDVTTRGLGAAFPRGLLVVHDGKDDSGRPNFKLVSLSWLRPKT